LTELILYPSAVSAVPTANSWGSTASGCVDNDATGALNSPDGICACRWNPLLGASKKCYFKLWKDSGGAAPNIPLTATINNVYTRSHSRDVTLAAEGKAQMILESGGFSFGNTFKVLAQNPTVNPGSCDDCIDSVEFNCVRPAWSPWTPAILNALGTEDPPVTTLVRIDLQADAVSNHKAYCDAVWIRILYTELAAGHIGDGLVFAG
jgi:hypothetical protein